MDWLFLSSLGGGGRQAGGGPATALLSPFGGGTCKVGVDCILPLTALLSLAGEGGTECRVWTDLHSHFTIKGIPKIVNLILTKSKLQVIIKI